jgi:hypothetical protein
LRERGTVLSWKAKEKRKRRGGRRMKWTRKWMKRMRKGMRKPTIQGREVKRRKERRRSTRRKRGSIEGRWMKSRSMRSARKKWRPWVKSKRRQKREATSVCPCALQHTNYTPPRRTI